MENTKIAAAFVKAQKGFAPALKNSINPHFRSKYADLSACIEAVIDALHANGIGLIQKTLPCENGITVETVFVHESGEQMTGGVLHVPAPKQDPQGYGSALSYARRYSLMAACGIAPEDDDGNAASKAPAPAAQVAAPKPTNGNGNGFISQPQAKRFFALAKQAGKTDAEIKAFIRDTYGIEKTAEMRKQDYEKACEWAQAVEEHAAPVDEDYPG